MVVVVGSVVVGKENLCCYTFANQQSQDRGNDISWKGFFFFFFFKDMRKL